MQRFRYLKNVATLEYAEKLCIGCGRCLEVCPQAVFVLQQGRAKIVDFDACMECGACAKNCPVAALTVTAGVGCAAGLLTEWLREKGVKANRGGC